MRTMPVYEFTLTLDAEPDLDTTDRLYGYFDANGDAPAGVQDFTLVTQAGVASANCTVEATSCDSALQSVLLSLSKEGLRAMRVEADEQGLAGLQAA